MWAVVHKDRFGNWLAVPPGKSFSGTVIRFSISTDHVNDIICEMSLAKATVTHRTEGASSPDLGDDIVVTDLDGCFLRGPPDLLAGKQGWAAKLEPETSIPDGLGYDWDLPVWAIFSMCSSEFSCG
jgi:hypothetical protein